MYINFPIAATAGTNRKLTTRPTRFVVPFMATAGDRGREGDFRHSLALEAFVSTVVLRHYESGLHGLCLVPTLITNNNYLPDSAMPGNV